MSIPAYRDEDREKCGSLMDWTASQKAKNYQHSAVSCQIKYRFIDERTLAARLGFVLSARAVLSEIVVGAR